MFEKVFEGFVFEMFEEEFFIMYQDWKNVIFWKRFKIYIINVS